MATRDPRNRGRGPRLSSKTRHRVGTLMLAWRSWPLPSPRSGPGEPGSPSSRWTGASSRGPIATPFAAIRWSGSSAVTARTPTRAEEFLVTSRRGSGRLPGLREDRTGSRSTGSGRGRGPGPGQFVVSLERRVMRPAGRQDDPLRRLGTPGHCTRGDVATARSPLARTYLLGDRPAPSRGGGRGRRSTQRGGADVRSTRTCTPSELDTAPVRVLVGGQAHASDPGSWPAHGARHAGGCRTVVARQSGGRTSPGKSSESACR